MSIRLIQIVLDHQGIPRINSGIRFQMKHFGTIYYNFANIRIDTEGEIRDVLVETAFDYCVKDIDDEFKSIELKLKPDNQEAQNEENSVMLIVTSAFNITYNDDIEKIAGISPEEGIFLMKEGSSIVISIAGINAIYTVVRIKGKLYLVKEY